MNLVLNQNKSSWDAMADTWFGSTALPVYGCLAPTEDELHLFLDLSGKKFSISAAAAVIPCAGADKRGPQSFGGWICRRSKSPMHKAI